MDSLLPMLNNVARPRREVAIAVRIVACTFVSMANEAGQLG